MLYYCLLETMLYHYINEINTCPWVFSQKGAQKQYIFLFTTKREVEENESQTFTNYLWKLLKVIIS